MRKTGPVNDFAPTPHGASAAEVLVRPAEPGDAARVARLLTLRGTSVEESREQAHRMISSLPVLLLALLPAAEAAGGEGPAGGRAAELDDDLLAPVALSGAFPLPRRLRASLPEPGGSVEAWMVSGLVIDPVARRGGVGRVLLTAVADAVQALRPAADLYSVVNATNHASIGLHLMVGFKRLARLGAFGTVTFEDGQGVLLRRAG